MPLSNYSHGFKSGLTIQNIPIVTQTANGNVFWVNSVKGSDGNPGTFDRPFATIDYTVGKCTANNGDIINVAAGHVETVVAAAGLALDVAGITVVFYGEGADRAYVTFTTAVSADMDIDANDITLVNPRFVAGVDALTGPIDINAANFKVINGQWEDGTGIDTTDCVVAVPAAIGLHIDGWRYVVGDGAGTQKQSHIQLNGVDNAVLKNIDIFGDFGTGNIENVTDEILNARLDDIQLKNENAGPIPGIVLDANATGQAKNVDIRVASGTTYTSNVAKLNWDDSCLGYNADGHGGDPIGTAGGSSIDGKLDTIIADVGDPSARTNFQNLEDMIGIPDAANSSLDDMIRTGYDTTAITADADGSIIEREESLQVSLGLAADSATTDNVHGKLGTDTEMADRSMFDLLGGAGFAAYPAAAAPANDVSVAEVIRAVYDDTDTISGATLPAAPTANSLAAFIASGGTALGTELADSKSLVDAVGSNGTTLAYGVGSTLGAIGTTLVVQKTLTSSAIVQAGVDITGVSSGGALIIEDIMMSTDGTGLAAGTNFTIESDNANGVDVFFAETVGNLGANKTENIASGSVTAIAGVVLETGKKLIAKSTVADCTGIGTIVLTIKLRRVAAGATVAAA